MTTTTARKTRKVQATNPFTGGVVTRGSKTMHYTHALVIQTSAQESYTIPAGSYTVPAKRIRGFRVPSHVHTLSRDLVDPAREESWGIISFHQSEQAARKAGQAAVSKSASHNAEAVAIYGDLMTNSRPLYVGFTTVEVEEI